MEIKNVLKVTKMFDVKIHNFIVRIPKKHGGKYMTFLFTIPVGENDKCKAIQTPNSEVKGPVFKTQCR